jgi:hypothetical protein
MPSPVRLGQVMHRAAPQFAANGAPWAPVSRFRPQAGVALALLLSAALSARPRALSPASGQRNKT